MLTCAIYLVLTVLIPLKMTHHSLDTPTKLDNKLWAVYWAIFAIFKGLQWNIWLLDYSAVHFLFLVIAIWLYHEDYKGGLFVADFIEKQLRKNKGAADVINTMSEKLKMLNLFEKSPVFDGKSE